MLIPSLFQVEGGTANGTSERRNRFFRPIGPTLDPTLEVTDHRSRQFLLGRHFQIRVLVAQSLEKQWLESVDGLDGRPSLLLLDQANVIEPEASFDFFCLSAVALVALLRQDRSILLEKDCSSAMAVKPKRDRQEIAPMMKQKFLTMQIM